MVHLLDKICYMCKCYSKSSRTTLNEEKAILKRKCMEMSLYAPNIFHLGLEVMVTKHTKIKTFIYTSKETMLKWPFLTIFWPNDFSFIMTHIHWMEILLKDERKKNLKSKCHDIQKKSLKWEPTLVCIFSHIEEENFENETKIH